MYSSGVPPMHMMSPNFFPPLGYGNVPFPQPFAPCYPPACNYYNNQIPGPFNSTRGTGPQMLNNFNSVSQMPLYSQPPPGYGINDAQMTQNCGTNSAIPPFQPVHMANVCSPSFKTISAPSAVPVNEFGRPPTTSLVNSVPKQNMGHFSRHDNRRIFDAKSSPYFCEACDRGFPTLNKFTLHKSEHITCGAEGCTFMAHAKVVEKHFMMQHRTGLFNRIVKGTSPEEVQKWIIERKKHFPTKEKIEVKQAQKEEMKKRGERYAERKRQIREQNEKFKSGPNNRNGRYGSRNFTHRRNLTRDFTKKQLVKIEDDDCVLRNIPPFKGTAFYLNITIEPQKERPVEHIISDDDDDHTVLSCVDDIVVGNCTKTKVNVISELEKSCETSRVREDSEEDCLDRYFKNCDTVNENDEKIEKRDKTDKSTSITKSTIADTKLPNNLSVTRNNLILPDLEFRSEPVSTGVSSLALIQSYDSDSENDDYNEAAELDNSKIYASAFIESKLQKNDSIEKHKSNEEQSRIISISYKSELQENHSSEENISKIIETSSRNSFSSPLSEAKSEKFDDSCNDSGPDECSSKSVLIETDTMTTGEIGSVKSSSIYAIGEETDKSNESKKRKRKRPRDSRGEIELNEETKKKPEEKLPVSILRRRKRYKPPTLLEKLLSSEIKHERNVILQCIRYVVEKDFFQVGKSDSF